MGGNSCALVLLQPTPVILLKEGTDTSQDIPQLVSNINACQVIAKAVRTTLGPRGMDKSSWMIRVGTGPGTEPWESSPRAVDLLHLPIS